MLEPTPLGILLLALAVLLGTARLLGEAARWLKQPAVLGELVAGVLLGPTVLGALAPGTQDFLFPDEGFQADALAAIQALAIVLFLLVAGFEIDLSSVWRNGSAALKVGAASTVIPFALGLAAAMSVPVLIGRERDDDPCIFALFVATALSISALPVIARTLMDLGLYRTNLATVIVSSAILNDVVGWTLFAAILGMMGAASGIEIVVTLVLTLAFAVGVLSIGRWWMDRSLGLLEARTHYPGGVLGFVVTVALVGASVTEWIGIHAIFGAFIVGVALGDSSHLHARARSLIDDFVSYIFAPLFFAGIGLRVDFLTHWDTRLVVVVLLLACLGKILGGVVGARWASLARRDQWAIGFAMNSRGAMEIILGTLALKAEIIGHRLFVALVVMAIVTSGISGPCITKALGRRTPKNGSNTRDGSLSEECESEGLPGEDEKERVGALTSTRETP